MKLIVYFLIAFIVFAYIVPFITTLIIKLFYYIKIKKVCKICKYTIVSSLAGWLFSSVRANNPEMFIKTEKAVYSIKNYGFYKKPNYYVFYDKNNVEVQIIRRIYWIGYVIIKNIKIRNVNYTGAEKYFGENILPVINITLFCPKCVGAVKLQGEKSSASYANHVNTQNAFKIFGKTVLKLRNIVVDPYSAAGRYDPVPNQVKGVEYGDLSNGEAIYGSYIYNVKSFINRRLLTSDEMVDNVIQEDLKKFVTRS